MFHRSNHRLIESELVGSRLFEFKKPLLILQNDGEDPKVIEQSQAYARSVVGSEYKWIQNGELTQELTGELNATTRSLRQVIREIYNFTAKMTPKIKP